MTDRHCGGEIIEHVSSQDIPSDDQELFSVLIVVKNCVTFQKTPKIENLL